MIVAHTMPQFLSLQKLDSWKHNGEFHKEFDQHLQSKKLLFKLPILVVSSLEVHDDLWGYII